MHKQRLSNAKSTPCGPRSSRGTASWPRFRQRSNSFGARRGLRRNDARSETQGHVRFVAFPEGYRLAVSGEPCARAGDVVQIDGRAFRVDRIGRARCPRTIVRVHSAGSTAPNRVACRPRGSLTSGVIPRKCELSCPGARNNLGEGITGLATRLVALVSLVVLAIAGPAHGGERIHPWSGGASRLTPFSRRIPDRKLHCRNRRLDRVPRRDALARAGWRAGVRPGRDMGDDAHALEHRTSASGS